MIFAKKSLGQNYLVDTNIVKKIINLTDIYDKNVLEIGPGKGALTEHILEKNPKSLCLIEKDNILSNELKLKYLNNKRVIIYNKDILKFDFKSKMKKNTVIFGNLPYNISSQILAKIVKLKENSINYSSIILMFQKELAERIIGTFNSPNYGRLSILVNYRLKILNKFNISPNCFLPKPKVESTVLHFKPIVKQIYNIKNLDNLEKVTNIFFSNKRKMINKTVKKLFNKNKLNLIKDLDLKSRPSDLKPEKYYEITELFEKI